MAAFNARLHWSLAIAVLVISTCFVAAAIFMDRMHHVEAPVQGETDMEAAIGWLGVCGAVFSFGCFGILMKTPSVQEANCDCMVFQCYYSFAVAVVCMLIWLAAGSSGGLTFNASSLSMGAVFATLWIISQVCCFNAVNAIGIAVYPVISNSLTIFVSFVWGFAIFDDPVHSWPGALGALVLILVGVCLTAASSIISDRHAQKQARRLLLASQHIQLSATGLGVDTARELGQGVCDTDCGAPSAANRKSLAAGTAVFGVISACLLGLCNGSLMVFLNCFQDGCHAIGIQAYEGSVLPPLAFLPSLAAGIMVMHPVLFCIYWGRSILAGRRPQFHFSKVAVSGLITGAFWAMGNFNAMFATVYLGQTIGFPLTQCCLILNGVWGILYYREIKGATAICTFVLASAIVLAGAALDGLSC